jgi:hypothetical protein
LPPIIAEDSVPPVHRNLSKLEIDPARQIMPTLTTPVVLFLLEGRKVCRANVRLAIPWCTRMIATMDRQKNAFIEDSEGLVYGTSMRLSLINKTV